MIIKHKITGKILFEGDISDLAGANLSDADLRGADLGGANLHRANLHRANLAWANLGWADLRDANLRWAYLRGANLSDADLRGASLQCCIGNGKEVRTLQTPYWTVVFYSGRISIGCEDHTVEEWTKFKNSRIKLMDEKALEFWNKYRDVILALATIEEEAE